MANAGPLTTTFSAPASCTTATGLYQIWESKTYHFEQGPLASMTDCFPSGYDAAATSQYYSPGVCPGGYTTACSSTDVVSSTVTETAYTCCPTGRVQYTCAASSASGSLGCTTMFGGNVGISLLTAISGSSTYSTAVIGTAGQGIGAHSIAVRLQAGDPTGSTVLATATSQVATSPQSTTSSSASTGLSTVGIAGIGIGAGALVLAISGILGFLLWMRRRKQRATRNTPLSYQHSTPNVPHRGPPPPRPPRPLGAPALGPRASPPAPPPKDPFAPPMSPAPSTASSDFKKAREVEILKVRNVEIRKKPPRGGGGDGASSRKSRDTTSTFGTLLNNGPFELPGEFMDDTERKKQQHMYEMYELYGEWPQSPTSTTTTTTTNNQNPGVLSSSKSFETLTSAELLGSLPTSPKIPSDASQGYFSAAPPSYGAQPAELEEPRPVVVKPQKSFEAARRHRRMPSGRWGRGTSWAPAELPTPDARGFV